MKLREKLALALADFFLVMAAVFMALGLRLDFVPSDMARFIDGEAWLFLGYPAVAVLVFYLFGLYEKVWRYAGTDELTGVVLASIYPTCLFQFLVLLGGGVVFPRTALVLAWMLTIFVCGGVRLGLRMASERLGRPITDIRTLIVGANDAGESVLREVSRARKRRDVVGFVDDDAAKRGMRLRGVTVRGRIADLPALIDAYLVGEIILAKLGPAQARQVMDVCRGKDVTIRTVPDLSDVVEGHFSVSQLRELSIEDLLEREPVTIDLPRVQRLIEGKRVLITGAGGSIGSEIARQVTRCNPASLVLLGRGENSLYEIGLELPGAAQVVCDVCRTEALRQVFEEHRPQLVFHAAAHKHVPMMELNPAEAVYNNVFGTYTVMLLAHEFEVERFVLLSTDKAVNPTSVMGATKRMAELLVAKHQWTGFAAVRFGNVLGSRGSVVPTFRRQIAMGGPVTITDPEMTRFFMTIPEAVALVLQAASIARQGEIYILDMGQPVKILDLARNLIRLSGFEPERDIEIRIVGPRPGEKTFEELVNRGEETQPSEAPKVNRVTSAPPGDDWPGERLERLRAASAARDGARCKALLQELVAHYEPSELRSSAPV